MICSKPLPYWRRTTAVFTTTLILLLLAFPNAYGFRPPASHSCKPARRLIGADSHNHNIIIRPELLRLSATATTTTTTNNKVIKTDAEWQRDLSPDAYNVLRNSGTEPANTSPLNSIKAATDEGTFTCAGCNSPLFPASTKYESGTGWPSFHSPLDGRAVELSVDYKLIVPRTEVRCATCDGHLGHVFDDGPNPSGKRYCLNGVALRFVRDGLDEELMEEVAERAAEVDGDVVVVKQPLSAVLPGAAFDGAVAALFLGTFLQRAVGGELLGVDAGLFGATFQFFPLVVGAFYAGGFLKKIAGAFVDE
mmetsp:Transcript_18442/g.34182  ORF Transcript_18442/g.34182 Transcript_18442/m.34182 type:complete len:307 (+) Transcript_18442:82-1002(+)